MYGVYGPGRALDNLYQGVLGIFLGNLLRGEPITILGDGEQARDFVYSDDIAEGRTRALHNPAANGRVINLGSGRCLSINQLAEAATAPARPGEQRSVRTDVPLAKSIFEREPLTAFEPRLAETAR